MEFVRSFLRRHFAGKPVVASRNVSCFLRLNTSQNPKHVQDAFGFLDVVLVLGKCFGFWEVFLGSETCFGFWGSVFRFWDVFWILGSVFGFWDVF